MIRQPDEDSLFAPRADQLDDDAAPRYTCEICGWDCDFDPERWHAPGCPRLATCESG